MSGQKNDAKLYFALRPLPFALRGRVFLAISFCAITIKKVHSLFYRIDFLNLERSYITMKASWMREMGKPRTGMGMGRTRNANLISGLTTCDTIHGIFPAIGRHYLSIPYKMSDFKEVAIPSVSEWEYLDTSLFYQCAYNTDKLSS